MVKSHEIHTREDTNGLKVTFFSDGGMSLKIIHSSKGKLHLHPDEVKILQGLINQQFPLDALGQI